MKIMIIGSGGREHALAWKAAQSPKVQQVLVVPGNAGTQQKPKLRNVPIAATDLEALVALAQEEAVDLTIVGPEQPLAAGIVDTFRKLDLRIFGPTQKAAQLEASKGFAKDFLLRHRIPTAAYGTFTLEAEALAFLRTQQLPLVIKADGLASGKGVVIATTYEQAENTIKDMLSGNKFGAAGSRVIVEAYLQGEELSYIVMADGTTVLPLASSQDHKTRGNGDLGPNTGGMGAYSPAPLLTESLEKRILSTVIYPTLAGLQEEGIHYQGFLYAGLMIGADGGINVLEFNCRLGDPETQPIMMRLESDLIELCLSVLDHKLEHQQATWKPEVALGVVMASAGYPGPYEKGHFIQGLEKIAALNRNRPTSAIQPLETVVVFHAGTKLRNGEITTDGGRVLCVAALGGTVKEAQENAYAAVADIQWPGAYYRTDIGHKAI